MADSKVTKALTEGMQIPCPKCMEPMNIVGQRCPNCQFEFSEEEVRANIASKKAIPKGCLTVFGVLAAIVVVIILVAVVVGPDQKAVAENPAKKEPAAEKPAATRSGKISAGEEYTWNQVAKEVVGKKLRDPDSAIYSDMKVYPGTEDRSTIICGYVNSKNAFGGMTGRQRFIAGGTVMLEEQFTKQQMNIAWNRFCR
ncbi:hypothetical protein [Sphingorhabdus sp. EL138]|uniref:hypothetical protein n=1 Tax=Sphingorhabdus sp. EL138 TaxID=2073156 RepID=UPI000D6917E4|nr:hypothetical protein [Sphingorhabdus sp. EL138]